MHAEERQGAEEQARHLSAPGMYTSDARQGGGERLHPGVVLLYMPVALTCLPCSWARASRRRRLAWGTCRPRDFSLMCRTTADAIQWVLSQDGGVEGAEGGWLPGALLLRTSADCCAFSRTCGNRSSATIVGYAFQCFALVQQEGARLPRGFPMWSLTRICCCFLWLIILLVESKLNWNWKWSLTRVMQSLTSTTLLEFHCYVG